MGKESIKTDNPAPYNMSALFYIELHELRKAKSRAFLTGDFHMYRDVLEEIYTAICFKMSKPEITRLDKMFVEAEAFLQNKSIYCKGKYRMIDRELIFTMHKYKMIFPNVKIPSIEDLRARFKLSQNDNDLPNKDEKKGDKNK